MLHSAEKSRGATAYAATKTLDRKRSVGDYAPLVKRLAQHMLARLPASVQLDDLIQAGMIGLMDAMTRFDESQGIQFETYAQQRIRGSMLDELRENDWLPRAARKALRDIEAAMHKLQQQLQRAPTEREIADQLGVSLAEYQQKLHDAKGYQLFHYDDVGDSEDDSYLERNLPDDRENPLEQLKDKRFRTELVKAIEGLPEREQLMMGLYYEQELNLREIAEILGVTESRVCQIHTQAVARLRTRLKNWGGR
jgi:RNA polymerase sigma factor for flagellar operon FliA